MKCPKCPKTLKVTHTYRVPGGCTQRAECECGCVVTTQKLIVHVDPGYGQGAAAVARRLVNGHGAKTA